MTHIWQCIRQLWKKYISLAREFQKYTSDPTCKHGVMDQGNYIKRASTWKFTEHDYHVQDNKYVLHTSVIISCVTTHFTEFLFCGIHVKSHGVIGLSKHYHLWLDTKLVHRNCAVGRITCACVTCNNMLGKTWDPGVYHTKQPMYQPFVDCTYCTVLGSFNG